MKKTVLLLKIVLLYILITDCIQYIKLTKKVCYWKFPQIGKVFDFSGKSLYMFPNFEDETHSDVHIMCVNVTVI